MTSPPNPRKPVPVEPVDSPVLGGAGQSATLFYALVQSCRAGERHPRDFQLSEVEALDGVCRQGTRLVDDDDRGRVVYRFLAADAAYAAARGMAPSRRVVLVSGSYRHESATRDWLSVLMHLDLDLPLLASAGVVESLAEPFLHVGDAPARGGAGHASVYVPADAPDFPETTLLLAVALRSHGMVVPVGDDGDALRQRLTTDFTSALHHATARGLRVSAGQDCQIFAYAGFSALTTAIVHLQSELSHGGPNAAGYSVAMCAPRLRDGYLEDARLLRRLVDSARPNDCCVTPDLALRWRTSVTHLPEAGRAFELRMRGAATSVEAVTISLLNL